MEHNIGVPMFFGTITLVFLVVWVIGLIQENKQSKL